jgi:hypothetical protein
MNNKPELTAEQHEERMNFMREFQLSMLRSIKEVYNKHEDQAVALDLQLGELVWHSGSSFAGVVYSFFANHSNLPADFEMRKYMQAYGEQFMRGYMSKMDILTDEAKLKEAIASGNLTVINGENKDEQG